MGIDSLQNKRVFVSGGAGVIGQELVPRLVSCGALVYVGDLKPRPQHFKNNIIYRQGDLNYISAAELQSFQPEIFIHLAATFERSTESYEFWDENFWNNVRLSNYLMTLIKDLSSIRRVVFASSYLIYNPDLYNFSSPPELPTRLDEGKPIYPRNLTGMAKLAHEIELRFLNTFRQEQFTTVCARIFRGYGKNSRDVISRWVRSLLQDEEILVYRKEGMFDYVYGTDTAEGLVRLAADNTFSGIINLGTGNARKVSEVVKVLSDYFPGMRSREVESDIPYEASEADISELKKVLNWTPEYTIEKSIPEIIEFEKNRRSGETSLKTRNILVTSSSKKAPMLEAVRAAAKKTDGKIKVFAGDINPNAITKYMADEFWLMPKTEAENVLKILDYCKQNNIGVIIPSRDGELLFWSQHSEVFRREGIRVMISEEKTVERCVDKLLFSEFSSANGIPAIPSFKNAIEVKEETMVVKERMGAGSLSIGINIDLPTATEHAKKLSDPIFQPFIEGEEISVDSYVDFQGRVKGVVLRKRELVINGESQVTTTFRNEVLEEELAEIVSRFGFRGHVIIQAIIDQQGKLHIIECNCRFGGASTLAVAAGLDSFYWFILESLGADLKEYEFIPPKENIRQIRFPSDKLMIEK